MEIESVFSQPVAFWVEQLIEIADFDTNRKGGGGALTFRKMYAQALALALAGRCLDIQEAALGREMKSLGKHQHKFDRLIAEVSEGLPADSSDRDFALVLPVVVPASRSPAADAEPDLGLCYAEKTDQLLVRNVLEGSTWASCRCLYAAMPMVHLGPAWASCTCLYLLRAIEDL